MLIRLRMLVYFGSTEPLELFLALASLGVGVWFALPGNQMPHGAPPYQVVMAASRVPLYLFGILFLTFGSVRLFAVLHDHRPVRRWIALAAAMVWAGMACLLALTDVRYPSVPPYTGFSLASLWVYWRLAADKALFPALEDGAGPPEG